MLNNINNYNVKTRMHRRGTSLIRFREREIFIVCPRRKKRKYKKRERERERRKRRDIIINSGQKYSWSVSWTAFADMSWIIQESKKKKKKEDLVRKI